MGYAEFQETMRRLQRGAASEMDKLVVSKYYLDNHMLAPDARPGPDNKHDLFRAFLKHQSEIINKMHNLQQEHQQPHTNSNSNVFQDNRVAKAQHMREICRALNVPHSQHVEAVIDHVTMQHTCQEILEKKEALRIAFGLRYQESRQGPQNDMGVKRGLEILNAMLASWGHTQIQKDRKRKLVSHQGRRMDHTPYKIVVLGRPQSEEHRKNRLCLENLDVRPR